MENKSFASLLLIVAGLLALGYGGYGYMSEVHASEMSPMALSTGAKQRIPVSIWAGVAAVLAGGLLMSTRKKG